MLPGGSNLSNKEISANVLLNKPYIALICSRFNEEII
jgi:hypothetical protein